jgi:hypothetical protein
MPARTRTQGPTPKPVRPPCRQILNRRQRRGDRVERDGGIGTGPRTPANQHGASEFTHVRARTGRDRHDRFRSWTYSGSAAAMPREQSRRARPSRGWSWSEAVGHRSDAERWFRGTAGGARRFTRSLARASGCGASPTSPDQPRAAGCCIGSRAGRAVPLGSPSRPVRPPGESPRISRPQARIGDRRRVRSVSSVRGFADAASSKCGCSGSQSFTRHELAPSRPTGAAARGQGQAAGVRSTAWSEDLRRAVSRTHGQSGKLSRCAADLSRGCW